MNKDSYLKAALIGGCIAGLLSVIPIVNWLNVICCLWVLVGGGIAVYILTTSAPGPITYGDGAMVGMLAGLIGGVIWGIINLLLLRIVGFEAIMVAIERLANLFPQFEELLEMVRTANIGMGMIIVGLFFSIIIYAIFGTLGGVIGTAILVRKKKEEPPAKA